MKRVNWLGNVALGLLLVLDLVLVGLVFTHQGKGATASPAAAVTPTATATTPAPTTTTTVQPAALAPALLSVVDAKTAWSATKGTCAKSGSVVTRTTDAGATWVPTKEQPYAALTRLDATSSKAAFVVGAGPACTLSIRSTAVSGDTWRSPTSVSAAWAFDIADPAKIHSTTGSTSTPCGSGHVTAFARISDTAAAVLCADNSTRATADAAAHWSKGPSVPSVTGLGAVVALASVGSGDTARLVAAAPSTDCAGVRILVSAAGKDFAPTACVPTSAKGPLPVALALQVDSPGTVWLLAGTGLTHSTGDFTTWTKAA